MFLPGFRLWHLFVADILGICLVSFMYNRLHQSCCVSLPMSNIIVVVMIFLFTQIGFGIFIYLFKIEVVHKVHHQTIKTTVRQQKMEENPIKLMLNCPSLMLNCPSQPAVTVSHFGNSITVHEFTVIL